MSVSSRNPAKDQVAIASAATTGFTAANTDRSQLSYAAEACIAALRAAGLEGELEDAADELDFDLAESRLAFRERTGVRV